MKKRIYFIVKNVTEFDHIIPLINSLDENGTVLDINKLRAQYGTIEFDQILYGLRHSASWYLHVLDNQLLANKKLNDALIAFVNEDFEKLGSIEPLKSYW